MGDIISQHVSAHKFQVVRSYCGHGICDLFHCAPNIPHYAHNKVQSLPRSKNTFARLLTSACAGQSAASKGIRLPEQECGLLLDGS